MSHSNSRQEYEFDRDTKLAALERYDHRCALCGGEETRDDRFEFNHELPIWFAKEVGGALPTILIKSLANCQPVHHSCHHDYHLHESRVYYRELAPVVLARFLQDAVDLSKDDWRYKLGLVKGNNGHD